MISSLYGGLGIKLHPDVWKREQQILMCTSWKGCENWPKTETVNSQFLHLQKKFTVAIYRQ